MPIDHEMLDVTTIQSASNLSDSSRSGTRKLCVRHQRMADEGINVAMQQVSCIKPVYV
jgi:hypothetical protein